MFCRNDSENKKVVKTSCTDLRGSRIFSQNVEKPLLFGLYVFFEALQEVSGIERENCSIRHVTVENIAYLSRMKKAVAMLEIMTIEKLNR